MPRNPAMETQGRSSSVLHVACHCAMLVAVLCAPMCAWAYDVRYTVVTSPSGVSARSGGYCPFRDGSHTMMPMKESFQEVAVKVMKQASLNQAPIGGWNAHVSCTTEPCEWFFNTGFMNGSAIEQATFLKGVVHNAFDHTMPVPGMYHKFKKGYPLSFDHPMGRVIPKMLDTYWINENRDYEYTSWVCEHYILTESELATAPLTDEFGFVIPSPTSTFPWWGYVLIGLAVLVVLISVLLIVFCCFLRMKKLSDDCDAESQNSEPSFHQGPVKSQPAMDCQGSAEYSFANRCDANASRLSVNSGAVTSEQFANGEANHYFSARGGYGGNSFVGRGGYAGNSFVGRGGYAGNSFVGRSGYGGNSFVGGGGYAGNSFVGRSGYGGNSFAGGSGYGGNSFAGGSGYGGNSFAGRGGYAGNSFAGGSGYGGNSFAGRGGYAGNSFAGRSGYGGNSFAGRGGYAGNSFAGGNGYGGNPFANCYPQQEVFPAGVVYTQRWKNGQWGKR